MSALEDVAKTIASKFLASYAKRVETTVSHSHSPKQVHDRVWGTIVLSPLEVALVDSPLIQRLRYLRQLGVAQWVYPTACHTRFEHTLGVLHQTHQLISAINQYAEAKYGKVIISAEMAMVLRAAALLHDVGHPVMSHVSEYALEVNPEALLELQRERKKYGEDVKLSEIVAALVVNSDEFADVLNAVLGIHVKQRLPTAIWAGRIPEFVEKVSKCILGQSISEDIPLLHELISGPFDADKLDYMIRDASMAGIPGIIDISRLIQKVMVKKVPPADLPKKLASRIPSNIPEVYLIGFPWSGLSVVDELLLTKMILFSKLYQHPKVVSIEAMIGAIVQELSTIVTHDRLVSFVYDILDDELVLLGEAALRARLGLSPSRGDIAADGVIDSCVGILERLRERNLFVRAFAFSAHNPSGPEGSAEITAAMVELVKVLEDRTALFDFREKVIGELINICSQLDLGVDVKILRSMVVIRKKLLPSQDELRRANIFPIQGKPKTFGETGIHKDAWSSSFVSAAPKGYIFAPREIAQLVFVATESVVAAKFAVAVPEWLMEEAKQSADAIRKVKLTLRSAGYYKGKARCIRPMLERLSRADVVQVVDEFADRFSAVQATMTEMAANTGDEAPVGGNSGMRKRALAWLDQFETSSVEYALDLLRRSRLLGRQEVVAMLKTFLKANPAFENASVVGLSQGNESSQIVQYYAADVSQKLKFYATLSEAAKENRSDPVIFVDDFCASGGQISNTLGSWFDSKELKKPGLNEQRKLALEPERDYLLGHKLAFCFVAAWDDGVKAVQKAIIDLGLQGVVHSHLRENELPVAFDENYIDSEAIPKFRSQCLSVGRQLLSTENWEKRKLEERLLGYGNRGLLLFFPYNSPAQSLTCMWAKGTVDGDEWIPLIPRRKKVT